VISAMKRREFITLLGGAAAWPVAARAQQGVPMRRIGVLMSVAADGPEGQARLAAFLKGLQQWGWTEGRNVRIEWHGSRFSRLKRKCRRSRTAQGSSDEFASARSSAAAEEADLAAAMARCVRACPAGQAERLARDWQRRVRHGGVTFGGGRNGAAIVACWIAACHRVGRGLRQAAFKGLVIARKAFTIESGIIGGARTRRSAEGSGQFSSQRASALIAGQKLVRYEGHRPAATIGLSGQAPFGREHTTAAHRGNVALKVDLMRNNRNRFLTPHSIWGPAPAHIENTRRKAATKRERIASAAIRPTRRAMISMAGAAEM
jgi:hypothetical protein